MIPFPDGSGSAASAGASAAPHLPAAPLLPASCGPPSGGDPAGPAGDPPCAWCYALYVLPVMPCVWCGRQACEPFEFGYSDDEEFTAAHAALKTEHEADDAASSDDAFAAASFVSCVSGTMSEILSCDSYVSSLATADTLLSLADYADDNSDNTTPTPTTRRPDAADNSDNTTEYDSDGDPIPALVATVAADDLPLRSLARPLRAYAQAVHAETQVGLANMRMHDDDQSLGLKHLAAMLEATLVPGEIGEIDGLFARVGLGPEGRGAESRPESP